MAVLHSPSAHRCIVVRIYLVSIGGIRMTPMANEPYLQIDKARKGGQFKYKGWLATSWCFCLGKRQKNLRLNRSYGRFFGVTKV